MSAPLHVNLVPMKRALDNNDLSALNAYLAALPQRVRNELLRVAGEKFSFATAEVEGVRYMLAADLAQRVYRHSDTRALAQLVMRWGKPLKCLRSAEHDVRQSLKQAFGLHPKAAWTMFATWEHFGIACLKSETPMARQAQEYFLRAGEEFAINAAAEQETGYSVQQLQQIADRLGAIEQRLTIPTPADLGEQQVLAARIANMEHLMRVGQIAGLRVTADNTSLAYEALMGQVAGVPVKTLAARDQHEAATFWGKKKREGWRTTYTSGDRIIEQMLGKRASKLMRHYNLHIEKNL